MRSIFAKLRRSSDTGEPPILLVLKRHASLRAWFPFLCGECGVSAPPLPPVKDVSTATHLAVRTAPCQSCGQAYRVSVERGAR